MRDGLLGAAELLIALVLLTVLSLALLAARRRWLSRRGSTFECSLRHHSTSATPGTGWVLGVARYGESGLLQWFRFFSYSWRPQMAFVRSTVRVLETRDPNPVEAVSLYAEQRIVRVEVADTGGRAGAEQWDLAMSQDSVTGLLSWLEAAPPGLSRLT